MEFSNQNINLITDINQTLEVEVKLNISADDKTVYYLRGLFYKSGTNKYCGYSAKNQDWFNGPYTVNEGWKNLPDITVSSGSAQTVLKSKLDSSDNDCNKSGEYNFKVQRYTNTGSSTIDDQDPLIISVNIIEASPTIIISPTKSPSATLKPKEKTTVTRSQTSKEATVKKNPELTTVQSLTPIYIKNNLPTRIASLSAVAVTSSVSAEIKSGAQMSTVAGITRKSNPNFLYIPLFVGISMVFVAALLSFRKINGIKR